jgi:hypothetical protein
MELFLLLLTQTHQIDAYTYVLIFWFGQDYRLTCFAKVHNLRKIAHFDGGKYQCCQMVYFVPKILILEGLGMENVGKFCGHLVYFIVIWFILLSFGKFCGHLVNFMVIW